MAKKKLLNEAVVRRFMGLAGMESNIVSNKLTEMYGKKMEEDYMEEGNYMEEDLYEEEDEDPMGASDMKDPAPEVEPEGELNIDEEAVMKAVEAYEDLGEVMDMLKDAVGAGEGPEEEPLDEPDMDDAADTPPDMGDDAAGDEEMLEGVELQLSEDEIVQEVARRVAKRIMTAKKAKAKLDEALGRKS